MRTQLLLFILVAALNARVAIAQAQPDESKIVEKIKSLGGTVGRDESLPGIPIVTASE